MAEISWEQIVLSNLYGIELLIPLYVAYGESFLEYYP